MTRAIVSSILSSLSTVQSEPSLVSCFLILLLNLGIECWFQEFLAFGQTWLGWWLSFSFELSQWGESLSTFQWSPVLAACCSCLASLPRDIPGIEKNKKCSKHNNYKTTYSHLLTEKLIRTHLHGFLNHWDGIGSFWLGVYTLVWDHRCYVWED